MSENNDSIDKFLETSGQFFLNNLVQKDISSLLNYEKKMYHQTCKSPDHELQFFRFYSIIEAWQILAAQQINLRELQLNAEYQELIKLFLFKLKFADHLIIFRGPIDLANGIILQRCLALLDKKSKERILLCLADYSHEEAKLISKTYDVRGIGLLKNTQKSSEHHKLLSIYYAILTTEKIFEKEVHTCFFSIPFGMVYLFTSLSMNGHKGQRQFTSTKYGYTFSSVYLTKLVTGTGMSDYTINYRLHAEADHIGYTQASLQSKNNIKLTHELRLKLDYLQKNKKVLWSSLARSEKLISHNYVDIVERVQQTQTNNANYLLCGKSFPVEYKNIAAQYPQININYIGWCDLNSLINYIDIYLDPVPHGGGFSLALSLSNSIPCIIPIVNTSAKSPSLIQALLPNLDKIRQQIGSQNFNIMFPQQLYDIERSLTYLIENDQARGQFKSYSKLVYSFVVDGSLSSAKKCLGF